MSCVRCEEPTCAQLGAAGDPAFDFVCVEHYKSLRSARLRDSVLKAWAAKPSGRCLNCNLPGVLYAAGVFCATHAPVQDQYPVWRTRPPLLSPEATEAPEPVLRAVPCPEDKMPSGVKQAAKWAIKHDWDYRVGFAIGPSPDEIQSVGFEARKDQVALRARFEKKDFRSSMGFKKGWYQTGRSMPVAIGWRDLIACLQGVDFAIAQRDELRRATLCAMDHGWELVEVISS